MLRSWNSADVMVGNSKFPNFLVTQYEESKVPSVFASERQPSHFEFLNPGHGEKINSNSELVLEFSGP